MSTFESISNNICAVRKGRKGDDMVRAYIEQLEIAFDALQIDDKQKVVNALTGTGIDDIKKTHKTKSRRAESKTPRKKALSGYTVFVREECATYSKEHPGSNPMLEVSRMWKTLSLEEQAIYNAKAKTTNAESKTVDIVDTVIMPESSTESSAKSSTESSDKSSTESSDKSSTKSLKPCTKPLKPPPSMDIGSAAEILTDIGNRTVMQEEDEEWI